MIGDFHFAWQRLVPSEYGVVWINPSLGRRERSRCASVFHKPYAVDASEHRDTDVGVSQVIIGRTTVQRSGEVDIAVDVAVES